uniref:Serine/arginine-rich splicing factor SR45 isoform X1 n=1 Tax=Nicotiana tabacum TaxID=4097 RepID=A0A1S3Y8R1_TOBAC|nr:PREDICTED: serine/arginine-rich splicing factor SR45-like isoform X1 [Nicotiana tabacum]
MVALFASANVYAPLPLWSSIRKESKYLFHCHPTIHSQHFSSSSSSSSSSLSIQPPTRYFQIVSCYPLSSSPTTRFNFNPSTKLFVSGLSFRTTEESLRNAFKDFGEIVEVNLVMDKIANRPRGFAFLHYATEEESQKAIEGMHGKDHLVLLWKHIKGSLKLSSSKFMESICCCTLWSTSFEIEVRF